MLPVEKVLCFRAQRCGGALSLCAFHGWVHKACIAAPPLARLLVFVWLCAGSGGGRWCYNNKLGSSVTLNSPIFQEESKQNWLLLRICTYYKCMQVSRALRGSTPPTRTLNPESKSLMEVQLSQAISSPPPSVLPPLLPTAEHK